MAESQDLIDILLEDHERMYGLLEQLDTEDDLDRLRPIFVELASALSAHEAIEHELLFPALRGDARQVHDRLGEHEEINGLLEEMRRLETSGFGFLKRACAVVLELRAHFEAEEVTIFPLARLALSDEERAALGARAAAVRAGAPAFPEAVTAG